MAPRSKAAKLLIPEAAMLDCGAILGKRGAGKSSLARLLLEHEVDVGHRCCFIDPMGDAAGLRLNPDKTPSRFQHVIIFGGASGDIAISEEDGAKVARIVGTHNISCIIDLSGMIQAEQLRFMAAFADVLYDTIKIPVTVFVDEAHLFAPQERGEASTKLLNRMIRLNSQGRKRGIFLWAMTQRPARINKSFIGGTETMIALKVLMPQDVKAIADWFESNGPDAVETVRKGLGNLKIGEGYVYASGSEFFERVQFPMHSTLDTGRTPLHGETMGGIEMPKVDVSALAAAFGTMTTGDPRDDEIAALKREASVLTERGRQQRLLRENAERELRIVTVRETRLLILLGAIQARVGAAVGSPQIEPLPIEANFEEYLMLEGEDGVMRGVSRKGDNTAVAASARDRMKKAQEKTNGS
jgi:hypothetical protein